METWWIFAYTLCGGSSAQLAKGGEIVLLYPIVTSAVFRSPSVVARTSV
jgi:hypothetical protein